jgi:hypothetical protein
MVSDEVGYTYTSDVITVNFIKDYYTIDVSCGTDGANEQGATVDYDDSVYYLESTSVVITILDEYILDSMQVNGVDVDISTLAKVGNIYTYAIANVDKDYEIIVNTKLVAYMVEVEVDEHIEMYVPDHLAVASGEGALVLFGIEEHYVVADITVNGVSILGDEVYDSVNERYALDILNVLEDKVVVITTKLKEYSLTLDVSTGGSVDTEEKSYEYGTSISITPMANANYLFDKLYTDILSL